MYSRLHSSSHCPPLSMSGLTCRPMMGTNYFGADSIIGPFAFVTKLYRSHQVWETHCSVSMGNGAFSLWCNFISNFQSRSFVLNYVTVVVRLGRLRLPNGSGGNERWNSLDTSSGGPCPCGIGCLFPTSQAPQGLTSACLGIKPVDAGLIYLLI